MRKKRLYMSAKEREDIVKFYHENPEMTMTEIGEAFDRSNTSISRVLFDSFCGDKDKIAAHRNRTKSTRRRRAIEMNGRKKTESSYRIRSEVVVPMDNSEDNLSVMYRVLNHRLQNINGSFFLDRMPVNFNTLMREANKILKNTGIPQMDNNPQWVID